MDTDSRKSNTESHRGSTQPGEETLMLDITHTGNEPESLEFTHGGEEKSPDVTRRSRKEKSQDSTQTSGENISLMSNDSPTNRKLSSLLRVPDYESRPKLIVTPADPTEGSVSETTLGAEEWGEEHEPMLGALHRSAVSAEKLAEIRKAQEESRRSISWSRPDFKTDWSDFELEVELPRIDESFFKMDIGDYNYPGVQVEEGKVLVNETHGYTFLDTTEMDANGNKRVVRKFLPRIHQRIRTYRKQVPVKVTFTKLTNDVELVEEEEDINEEMEVDEIINTCLVKKTNQKGEEIVEEKEIVEEIIKYPGKKKRFIKLKMINDLGETVEEQIELNDDSKRTNDIMKAAAQFFRKKTKTSGDADTADNKDGRDKQPSLAIPELYKAHDTHKELMKSKVIERLKEARDEQKALKEMNKYLGKKLCEHYDLKGPKDPNFVYDERGTNTEEEKQNYQKRLLEFSDVVNFVLAESKKRAEMISQAEKDTQRDAELLKKEKEVFYGLEESMIKDLGPSEESKSLKSMTFAELINQQKIMDNSLAKVRLECIRSKITLEDLEDKKMAHQNDINNMEKVDFINFETLRVKTQDLNDKLDLKEKQVLTMKDRLTQRVQALAHVRLKSDHLTVENEKLRTETKDIMDELNALRKECLLVQIERRKLEKLLNKVKSKEGIEKYPYLVSEADIVEAKGEEQLDLLGHLVNTCTNLKVEMKAKLEERRIGVEKHQRTLEMKRKNKKLYSIDLK